jgi:hypothetical protein
MAYGLWLMAYGLWLMASDMVTSPQPGLVLLESFAI